MTSPVPDKGAVIVTGASRGIGASIAERLAEDGYRVVVNYAARAEAADAVVSAINARGGGRAAAVAPASPRRMTSPRCSTGRSS